MMKAILKDVIIKPGKEQSVRRYHPWIFSGAIHRLEGNPQEGDVVKIYSGKNEFLAIGHFQTGSLAVRIFSFDDIYPDYDFWKNKLENALKLRQRLNLYQNPLTNAYRLVNGEGDFLPGLIIDYYNGTAVIQLHSIGMFHIRELLADILQKLYGNKLKAVFDKSENTIPGKKRTNLKNGYLYGSNSVTEITENGNHFAIDHEQGQKTGFFIDQRENRELVGRYSQGRNVLNMFCYTGSFSVYAMKAGAKLVHSVDSSVKAIQMTNDNIARNLDRFETHHAFASDAMDYLNHSDETYDLIILDPPAFAKHRNALNNALQGYKKLNIKAFQRIAKGGLVFTFSCSQVVSRENFRKAVFAAAANTGRRISIMHHLSQSPDHPVSIYHPEGEYLKGLAVYVE
jgi:23S rRNA (cytosine1962-C5)-methyltransferase